MKEGSLEHRILRATLVYVMIMLCYAIAYRIYLGEYWTVIGYILGIGFTGWVWSVRNQMVRLQPLILPWLLFMYVLAVFLWFKTGGLQSGGMVFFTVSFVLILISPKQYRARLAMVFGVTQLILVLCDVYFPDLPLWGVNTKSSWDFLLLSLVNLSLVSILKTNYDLKEDKIGEFSKGLRELHRLNLRHDSNLDDVLKDYLNSGTELLGMQTGLIVEIQGEDHLVRNCNETIAAEYQAKKTLEKSKLIVNEAFQTGRSVYRAGQITNLDQEKITDTTPPFFIASSLIVNNAKYGVLLFSAEASLRNRFEDYDLEIIELMAINISHLLNMKVWRDHQAETDKALQFSEKRFKSIYDYANVGICVCDMEGKVMMANRALQTLFEHTENEMRGETFYSISSFGDLDEVGEDISQYERIILGDLDHYVIEKRKISKSGRHIYINKTVSAIRDEYGAMLFTVMIIDDITNRKANEEKITNLNQALEIQVDKMEEANKELEAFSYSVSHDLRAPLRAIDGFSKIILEDHEDEFSEESKRLLNVIIKNSGKMATLIDDLLTFSRITRKVAEFKPLDLNKVVRNVIGEQDLNPNIFQIDHLPEAKGEKILMKQVYSNLIGNAVKFSSKVAAPKIEIGAVDREDHLEFFVKDNGVGFNMAYYNKIFGVFQRLHTDEEFKGTGVGLAIVQKVMMKHHGKVWAESEEGKGATFYFTLPK
ncbi:ATP-binding protein [Reichenbachiella carrageenanivorans]|uniref:histidine kinase n=1 Tax=Reichenbachiella carrageenanivorans TaxID=2979869 RepID=A0ABY6D1V1_9BACT|nr:ATP-binding protein [Reichenbachiella carrageenanivorans]UXX80108.1 ATP-binding protein [Reichenbachiella carrageenanivorans]